MEESSSIVKVNACGVSVEVDKSRMADVRFSFAMGALSDATKPLDEKLVWYGRALDILFGGEVYEVMTKLADANGGELSMDTWQKFYAAILEQCAEKN